MPLFGIIDGEMQKLQTGAPGSYKVRMHGNGDKEVVNVCQKEKGG